MKKALLILLAGMILLCFAACGTAADTASETPASSAAVIANADDEDVPAADLPLLIINNEPITVTVSDGFNNAGYTGRICGATATYTFRSSTPDVTWSVYVLDEAFPDILRYLSQANTPALEGDGSLEIEEGKFVYIYCSENGFTSTDAPSDATLTINYAE